MQYRGRGELPQNIVNFALRVLMNFELQQSYRLPASTFDLTSSSAHQSSDHRFHLLTNRIVCTSICDTLTEIVAISNSSVDRPISLLAHPPE